MWVGLCRYELWVRILCVDRRSRCMYIVLGGYMCILGAPSVQSCCTLSITASYHVFVYGRYCKSRLVYVCLSGLDLSRHHPLLWGGAPAIQRVRMVDLPKKLFNRRDSSTACRLCRFGVHYFPHWKTRWTFVPLGLSLLILSGWITVVSLITLMGVYFMDQVGCNAWFGTLSNV